MRGLEKQIVRAEMAVSISRNGPPEPKESGPLQSTATDDRMDSSHVEIECPSMVVQLEKLHRALGSAVYAGRSGAGANSCRS